jgi:ABC-2 type transport system ATP-binding protein
MTYTVEVEGLHKAYGETRVLDGLDLTIDRGTVYGLLGPNGAGKTTLVRILATLVRADAGVARIDGLDLATRPREVRRVIGLTGQYAAVDELLTGRENLEMMSRLRKLPARTARHRAAGLLEEFDLAGAADRRAGTYSGGMKRRLDLAVSMIERPSLLFLDEPTTGLDPRSREQVWGSVRDLARAGVTILLTTQYLEEADRLCDRVGVLDQGRIVAEGSPDELKATVGAEQVRLELADGTVETVTTDGSPAALAAVLAEAEHRHLDVRRVETVRPSLDDVFLSLTRHPATAA